MTEPLLLKGKSVVITGAGSGVGRAAAEIFAQHGALVVCADVQDEWAEKTVARVKEAGVEAKAVHCDVRNRGDLQAAVDMAVGTYGRLDIMFNNAGIASPPNALGGAAVTNFGIGSSGQLSPERLELNAKMQPLGRILDPEDSAHAALYLASDLSRNVTGVNLPVDGGVTAGR